MKIEFAKLENSKCISEMVKSAAEELRGVDFNEEGWRLFIESTSKEKFEEIISNPEYMVFCCFENDKVIGLISLQNLSKVVQLFVHPMARKRGIASKLWNFAKEHSLKNGSSGQYWLRSSSIALPVYKKFGFIPEGERQVFNGISFQVMRFQNK